MYFPFSNILSVDLIIFYSILSSQTSKTAHIQRTIHSGSRGFPMNDNGKVTMWATPAVPTQTSDIKRRRKTPPLPGTKG